MTEGLEFLLDYEDGPLDPNEVSEIKRCLLEERLVEDPLLLKKITKAPFYNLGLFSNEEVVRLCDYSIKAAEKMMEMSKSADSSNRRRYLVKLSVHTETYIGEYFHELFKRMGSNNIELIDRASDFLEQSMNVTKHEDSSYYGHTLSKLVNILFDKYRATKEKDHAGDVCSRSSSLFRLFSRSPLRDERILGAAYFSAAKHLIYTISKHENRLFESALSFADGTLSKTDDVEESLVNSSYSLWTLTHLLNPIEYVEYLKNLHDGIDCYVAADGAWKPHSGSLNAALFLISSKLYDISGEEIFFEKTLNDLSNLERSIQDKNIEKGANFYFEKALFLRKIGLRNKDEKCLAFADQVLEMIGADRDHVENGLYESQKSTVKKFFKVYTENKNSENLEKLITLRKAMLKSSFDAKRLAYDKSYLGDSLFERYKGSMNVEDAVQSIELAIASAQEINSIDIRHSLVQYICAVERNGLLKHREKTYESKIDWVSIFDKMISYASKCSRRDKDFFSRTLAAGISLSKSGVKIDEKHLNYLSIRAYDSKSGSLKDVLNIVDFYLMRDNLEGVQNLVDLLQKQLLDENDEFSCANISSNLGSCLLDEFLYLTEKCSKPLEENKHLLLSAILYHDAAFEVYKKFNPPSAFYEGERLSLCLKHYFRRSVESESLEVLGQIINTNKSLLNMPEEISPKRLNSVRIYVANAYYNAFLKTDDLDYLAIECKYHEEFLETALSLDNSFKFNYDCGILSKNFNQLHASEKDPVLASLYLKKSEFYNSLICEPPLSKKQISEKFSEFKSTINC